MRKVFGIGLNKTGTTTLGVCLKTLGYKHSPYAGRFVAAAQSRELDELLAYAEAWDSFEDWPWPLLYRELDERFPGSRFVLTTRNDAVTWFRSLCGHAERTGPTPERRLIYGHEMPQGHRVEHLKLYEEHVLAVRAWFQGRPEALLEVCWERGAGWPELCRFLGAEQPGEPFPHAHQAPGLEA